jgi:hypothetical protein
MVGSLLQFGMRSAQKGPPTARLAKGSEPIGLSWIRDSRRLNWSARLFEFLRSFSCPGVPDRGTMELSASDVGGAVEPDRARFLAVPPEAHAALFDTAPGRDLVAAQELRVLVFDPDPGVIVQWIE